MGLNLERLARETSWRPASCLECGQIVSAVDYCGRTEIMPANTWWASKLPDATIREWEQTQGFAWAFPGGTANHLCRPYMLGTPDTPETVAVWCGPSP
jgi:hypothetical protein